MHSANVQGKWNMTIETPMGARSGVLELKVDGATLTGAMYDANHRAQISDGRVDGNELQWSATLASPRLTLKFRARVEGDSISGSARHFLGSARFSGTRGLGLKAAG